MGIESEYNRNSHGMLISDTRIHGNLFFSPKKAIYVIANKDDHVDLGGPYFQARPYLSRKSTIIERKANKQQYLWLNHIQHKHYFPLHCSVYIYIYVYYAMEGWNIDIIPNHPESTYISAVDADGFRTQSMDWVCWENWNRNCRKALEFHGKSDGFSSGYID